MRTRRALTTEEVTGVISSLAETLQGTAHTEKLRNALELHAAQFSERQVRVRFLLLVTAMEALSSPTPKHPAATSLLAQWKADARQGLNQHEPGSKAHESLQALLRELKFRGSDSIRPQLRKLFEWVPVAGPTEAQELGRRVLHIYDQRSTLLHEGHIPHQDLAALEVEARTLLERLLMSFLVSPEKNV